MSIVERLKENPLMYKNIKLIKNRLNETIPDEIVIKSKYRKKLGKDLNLSTPKTFNEKLQWLKLNWRVPVATICADKYEVRGFVKEKLGEEILNELLGVYTSTKEINLDELPESFVLKVTHGSGQNIICKNKNDIDWENAFLNLEKYLYNNSYLPGREWPYKNITPRIIAEKFLDNNGEPPVDYKFFCFNGNPEFIQLDTGRFKQHKRNFYDLNWRPLEIQLMNKPKEDEVNIQTPVKLDEMTRYAKVLSNGFPFSRIDLYEVNGKVYFGEITFYPESGFGRFYPEEIDLRLGEKIQLPNA